jgi:hypothetical protein
MKPVRNRFPILLLFFIVMVLSGPDSKAVASDHKLAPVGSAKELLNVETHKGEGVYIAAEPYDTPEKEKIFRVDYMRYGFLPIRLVVTNESDRTLSLEEARILFQTVEGINIQAADPEDIDRRTTDISPLGKIIPLPAPLPPIHRKPRSKDPKIEQDFKDFEYTDALVEPKSTKSGFLFYDVQGIKNPLRGGSLLLRKVQWVNHAYLYDFEISMDKYASPKPE